MGGGGGGGGGGGLDGEDLLVPSTRLTPRLLLNIRVPHSTRGLL